jgi:uncharacterized membrane-anchored protein
MAAIDTYGYSGGVEGPADNLAAVTLDDSNDLSYVTKAVHVGTAGDLKVTTVTGLDVVIKGAAAGWHRIRVKRIWSTGTAAADVTAAW